MQTGKQDKKAEFLEEKIVVNTELTFLTGIHMILTYLVSDPFKYSLKLTDYWKSQNFIQSVHSYLYQNKGKMLYSNTTTPSSPKGMKLNTRNDKNCLQVIIWNFVF